MSLMPPPSLSESRHDAFSRVDQRKLRTVTMPEKCPCAFDPFALLPAAALVQSRHSLDIFVASVQREQAPYVCLAASKPTPIAWHLTRPAALYPHAKNAKCNGIFGACARVLFQHMRGERDKSFQGKVLGTILSSFVTEWQYVSMITPCMQAHDSCISWKREKRRAWGDRNVLEQKYFSAKHTIY